jgi:hypothetical protein
MPNQTPPMKVRSGRRLPSSVRSSTCRPSGTDGINGFEIGIALPSGHHADQRPSHPAAPKMRMNQHSTLFATLRECEAGTATEQIRSYTSATCHRGRLPVPVICAQPASAGAVTARTRCTRFQKSRHLSPGEVNDTVLPRRPAEPTRFQSLGYENHAAAVPEQELDPVRPFGAEHVDRAGERVRPHCLPHPSGQPVDALAEVHGPRGQVRNIVSRLADTMRRRAKLSAGLPPSAKPR